MTIKICERCGVGEASHRVSSDILQLDVCDSCSTAAAAIEEKFRDQPGSIRIDPIPIDGKELQ